MRLDRQPVITGVSLLLELAGEGCADVLQTEGTHGRATDRVWWRVEDTIDDGFFLVPIASSEDVGDVLGIGRSGSGSRR